MGLSCGNPTAVAKLKEVCLLLKGLGRKEMRTSVLREARFREYVALRSEGTSLLMEARKVLTSRYVARLDGSRKYWA